MVSCSCMLLSSLFIGILAVFLPLSYKYFTLNPEAVFALTNPSVASYGIQNPSQHHSRYRVNEFHKDDRYFFQWWNYLVYDAETNDHWSLVYLALDFSENFMIRDSATVAMGHNNGATKVDYVRDAIPLDKLTVKNSFDLFYHTDYPNNEISYTHVAINDDQYHIYAKFPPGKSGSGVAVEWNLTFYRVKGFYGISPETEKSHLTNCYMLSSIYSYHSEVEGTIKEGDKLYQITRDSRYRAYGAGSWGCKFPTGVPPIKHPWSWLWLIIPNATVPQLTTSSSNSDIGMTMGVSTSQLPLPLGKIHLTATSISLNDLFIHASKLDILQNTSFAVTFLSACTDEYLVHMDVERSDWIEVSDEFGSAKLPHRQIFKIITKSYSFEIDLQARVGEYMRVPLVLEGFNGTLQVFSDFRAIGVPADLTIKSRTTSAEGKIKEEIVYKKNNIRSFTAMEYAYETELSETGTDQVLYEHGWTLSKK